MPGSTSSDTLSDSDTDLTFPLANDSTEEDEQDADCACCTSRLSEGHNGEEWIRCAECFRWAHTLCTGMEEGTVVRLARDTLFGLSLYPSYL